MKNATMVIVAVLTAMGCQPQKPAQSESAAAPVEVTKESLKTADDKMNYAVGVEIGKNIKRNGLSLKDDLFMKGLHDGIDEKEPLIPEEEMQTVKREHAKAQRELREKEREAEAEKNKAEGEKFLAENAKKEGVVTTESGLQYKIIKEGDGEKPGPTDKVSVHYKGTLIDGTAFDSSYERGKPATFGVNRVVKGWTEALQLMPVGSKWEVYIPSELGYGERGSRGTIGPNAVLIFEMELLEIIKEDDKPGDPSKKTVTINPKGDVEAAKKAMAEKRGAKAEEKADKPAAAKKPAAKTEKPAEKRAE